jgi:hypothetical protein
VPRVRRRWLFPLLVVLVALALWLAERPGSPAGPRGPTRRTTGVAPASDPRDLDLRMRPGPPPAPPGEPPPTAPRKDR